MMLKEKLFDILFQDSGHLTVILDEKGNFLYVAPATLPIIGIRSEVLIGKNVFGYIHPDDQAKTKTNFARLRTEKQVLVKPVRFRIKEIEYRWIEIVFTNLLDDPDIHGIVLTARDVTERIEKEKFINRQIGEINKIFDFSNDVICAVDEDGKLLKVSTASLTIWGYSPGELIGTQFINLVIEEDRQRTLQIADEIMLGKLITDFENRNIRKNGSIIPLAWSVKWDEKERLMYCIARRTTEKSQLEKILRNEQQRFARMFEEAPLSMCILKGPKHVFQDANENYSLLTGRRNIKGKTVREVFPELTDQGYFYWLDEVYQTGKTFSGNEIPLVVDLDSNGALTTRYISFNYQPYFDNEGKVEGIFYFGIDVTEQVELRKKIEQNEKRFRSLIEYSHDILVLFDESGTQKYVSPAFKRTLGYHPNEVIGTKVFDKVHPDDAECFNSVVKKAFVHSGVALEACARFRKKDGNYVWLEGFITNMLHVEEVNALVVNFRNIDERKKVEEEKELILNISNIFSREANLKESLHDALKAICFFTGAKGAQGWITSIDQEELRLASYYLPQDANIHAMKEKFALGEGTPGRVWQLKNHVYISNIAADNFFQQKEFAQHNHLQTALAIPVIFKEDVTAVIVLYGDNAHENRLKSLGQNVLIQLASDIQRKKTEEELERYFKMSGDLLCVAGVDGYYKKVNPAFTKALGYLEKELLNTSIFDLVHPDDLLRTKQEIKKLSEGKETFNFENRLITKDGKVRYFVWTATLIQENLVFALAKDVTDIKKVEKEAESYSKRIGVILESVTDAFLIIDSSFTVAYWNQQAAKLIGVDKNGIVGKNLWEVFPDAKELKFFDEYQRALTKNTSVRFEAYYPRLKMWFDVSAYPLDEGLSIYFRDITESKNNYLHLVKTETDVRNFARQLNSMLEEERSRIAREIHDEFGQQLAAIKMSLGSLKRLAVDNGVAKAKLEEVVQDIENTMHSLRSFATELRPGILDTMGLMPSLEWLAKEFGKKTGIKCYLDFDSHEYEMEKTTSTCYFRICQEALTNVLKHAHAQNVVIQVYEEASHLLLNIVDDGIGIVEEKIQNPFSMGILGMKERANLIGGTLLIRRGTFGGTIVQLKAKIHVD